MDVLIAVGILGGGGEGVFKGGHGNFMCIDISLSLKLSTTSMKASSISFGTLPLHKGSIMNIYKSKTFYGDFCIFHDISDQKRALNVIKYFFSI